MDPKWFVQNNDGVDGPLTSEEVRSRLQNGLLSGQDMIWSKALPTWRKLENWDPSISVQPSMPTIERTIETWHYALNGKSHGPFRREELVNILKGHSALADVMVWTKGMKEWAPLFEFHDLLSAMGVNKRQFPRADVNGTATIKSDQTSLSAPLITISESGCSVHMDAGLNAGQNFSLEIKSTAFKDPIHAKAECRYLCDGICGIKFTQINDEDRGRIIQFIRQSQTRFVLKAA